MDFWSKHTPRVTKISEKTLENTIHIIHITTQLDKYCIDPGIQPPFPASRGIFCQLDALAGGKLGALVTVEGLPCSCRCGPSGSWPEMHFLLHLVCALLTDVNQTQLKFISLWIITHHSKMAADYIFDAALVRLLDIESINPPNKNPPILQPSKTVITENRK